LHGRPPHGAGHQVAREEWLAFQLAGQPEHGQAALAGLGKLAGGQLGARADQEQPQGQSVALVALEDIGRDGGQRLCVISDGPINGAIEDFGQFRKQRILARQRAGRGR
jgi:hypothetical protein